jgi:putative ABC transport system permease protein
MPVDQHPLPSTALTIVVRTASDPAGLGDALGRAIRSQNPNVAVRLDTMEGRLSSAVAAPRFRAVLLGIFAAVALGLAIAGVYGVMAYVVSQRVSEIGVRIALGASNRDVLWLVFAQGARLTVAGLALGMVISFAVTRLLSTLLFDVTARDPLVYVVVGAALVAAALGACYAPARRAMRVDPMMALRAE